LATSIEHRRVSTLFITLLVERGEVPPAVRRVSVLFV